MVAKSKSIKSGRKQNISENSLLGLKCDLILCYLYFCDMCWPEINLKGYVIKFLCSQPRLFDPSTVCDSLSFSTGVTRGRPNRKQTTAMSNTRISLRFGFLRIPGKTSVSAVARLSTHTN